LALAALVAPQLLRLQVVLVMRQPKTRRKKRRRRKRKKRKTSDLTCSAKG
jgi:hypothetical protein